MIRERGTVQITTVIGNANAPKRYDYPMRLARGQSLHLNEDGSVVAAGRDGSFTAYVASPWAKDANGDAASATVHQWFLDNQVPAKISGGTVGGTANGLVQSGGL